MDPAAPCDVPSPSSGVGSRDFSPTSLLASGGALLSSLLGSPRHPSLAAAAAASPPGGDDLERPLLGGSLPSEEAALEQAAHAQPKPWPQLRCSSVSTRRYTPGLLAQELAAHAQSAPDGCASPSLAWSPIDGTAAPRIDPRVAATLPAKQEAAASAAAAAPQRRQWARHGRAVVAGVVDSAIALPLQLAFAAIIFRDPWFHTHLGSLVKLVVLSSALHQLTVVACSRMRFVVGQVQDVGLIFLSAIASAVVQQCVAAGVSAPNTLATVLAAVSLTTGIVGILIMCTGALKLARLVQYVPLPVVGGYLSYVGLFVLESGISLATGLQIRSLASWRQLADTQVLLKLAPALALVLLISLVMHRIRSPLALPALMLAAPLAFYGVLYACGLSLADARAAGWVSKLQPGDGEWRFWRAWSLYNIHDFPPSNIYYQALPSQLGKLATLMLFVAFGSSMDIAAIQADAPLELDFNSELITIGASNLVTAASGFGFTGSFIFSQTLFVLRMGADSRLMGLTLAAIELAVFMAPINVMAFLPKFYFGGLTAWIGQDILKDWLFLASNRMAKVEYALLLATFALVLLFGLEVGIGAGIVLAALHFAYSYSRVHMTASTVVPSRSGAVRTFDQRTVLDMFLGRISAVSLTGYIFFGSSLNIMETVLRIARSTLDSQPHVDAATVAGAHAAGRAQQQQPGQLASLPSSSTLRRQYDNVDQVLDCAKRMAGDSERGGSGGAGSSGQLSRVAAALAESPRFLILDLRRVQGLDATAARSFVTLHSRLHRMGIQLLITHLPGGRNEHIRRRLAAQGLVLIQPPASAGSDWHADGGPVCPWFPTMDAANQHCEELFLATAVAHGLCPPPARRMSLAQVLQANLELPRCALGGGERDYLLAAALLQRFTAKQELRAGNVLFDVGGPSDDIFLLESGTVVCHVDFALSSTASRAQLPALPAELQPPHVPRRVKFGAGSVLGELDFFLQRTRSFSAVVEAPGSAWRISRRAFELMGERDPATLNLLQQMVLRSTSLSAAHALEALDRVSHTL
ncbi:hypothetical protein ABPG75_007951 [Micractinium tetrahymenae]